MTSDLDIYHSAQVLIEQHGLKGASDHAADRIAELTERGDRNGAFAWRKIRAALLDLSDVRFKSDSMN